MKGYVQISISELREKLPEIQARVQYKGESFLVVWHKKPVFAIVPPPGDKKDGKRPRRE